MLNAFNFMVLNAGLLSSIAHAGQQLIGKLICALRPAVCAQFLVETTIFGVLFWVCCWHVLFADVSGCCCNLV